MVFGLLLCNSKNLIQVTRICIYHCLIQTDVPAINKFLQSLLAWRTGGHAKV